MKINIANNSPLAPQMHAGYRRSQEQFNRVMYPFGGERLHRKQRKTISEILRDVEVVK